MGDATFEQEITAKFLSVISENLLAFQQYLEAGDIIKLKATGHYTRSTIFIMDLNRLLDQFLNAIEYGNLPLKESNVQVKNVVKILNRPGGTGIFKYTLLTGIIYLSVQVSLWLLHLK